MNLEIKNPNDLPLLSIKELIPTQGELKDLTEANYNKLKLSFEKHGFIFPISIWQDGDKNYLIDGHQRQRVITKEYGDVEVPIIKIPAKDIKEAAEILLKVTSQYGTITQEGLDTYIATYELPEAEIYEATHYDAISYLQQEDPEVEEDEPPEVGGGDALSVLGTVYQLGKHRVMCGDSLKDADKLFDTATIAFTSPPYNVGHNLGYKNKDSKYIESDDNDDWLNLLSTFQAVQENKTEFQFINLQFLANNKRQTLEFLFSNVDKFVDVIFWKKSQVQPAMAENVVNSQTECIWVFRNEDKPSRAINTGNFRGNVTNIIETSSASAENDNSDIHNATMPVELASYFVKNFTKKGDSVYDAFIGTGTTLIACEQTDRTCYGMELDPKYVDVIRKRYAKFISPDNQLPENWEELTPAISGGNQAK